MRWLEEIREFGHVGMGGKLWLPACLSLVFAAFGRAARGVTLGGALTGAVVCFALLLAAGVQGFAALLAVFVLTWGATRLGYARKQSLGAAERPDGRNAAQVFANLGVASLCALLYVTLWRDSRLVVAAVAALAEAAADTVSSEIGQAFGGIPRLITNYRSVTAGTDGAVTFAGTTAGVAAAIAVTFTGVSGWRSASICASAGVFGMIADSVLGATLERRGFLGNNAVNFSSTLVAAMLAFIIV